MRVVQNGESEWRKCFPAIDVLGDLGMGLLSVTNPAAHDCPYPCSYRATHHPSGGTGHRMGTHQGQRNKDHSYKDANEGPNPFSRVRLYRLLQSTCSNPSIKASRTGSLREEWTPPPSMTPSGPWGDPLGMD